MIFLDEIKDLKVYKKPFFLPVNDDKQKGSAIFLLTPNYKSSKEILQYRYILNRNRSFKSFYIEKNINYFISSKAQEVSQEAYIYMLDESALTSADRNDIEDKDFGIPEIRKYPLIDEKHVIMAIQFFNKVEPKYEKILADNIKKAIAKYNVDITIGKKNKLYKYMNESTIIPEEIPETSIASIIDDEAPINIEFVGAIKDIKNIKIDHEELEEILDNSHLKDKKHLSIRVNVGNNDDTENKIEIFKTDGNYDTYKVTTSIISEKEYSNIHEDYYNYVLFTIVSALVSTLNPRCSYTLVRAYTFLLTGLSAQDKNTNDLTSVLSTMDFYNINEIIMANNIVKIKEIADNMSLQITLEAVEEVVEEAKRALDGKYLSYMKRHIMYAARRHRYKTDKIKRDMENFTKDAVENNLPTIGKVPPINSNTSSSDNSSDSSENKETIKELAYYDLDDTECLKIGENYMFFNEDAKFDPRLRQILFSDRIKQDKEVLLMYKKIKEDLPFVKFAYTRLDRYQGKNLFVDLSFYNETFFRNNTYYKLDNAVDLYMELMARLLSDSRMSEYSKKTIFIPVMDWDLNVGTKMWMYRLSINPISVIHRMMTRNPQKLRDVFGDKDIIFMSPSRYFKLNLSHYEDFKKLPNKFKLFIEKFRNGEEFDIEDVDDSTNIESPKAIAVSIIDKLEDTRGIKINDKQITDKIKSNVISVAATSKPIKVNQNDIKPKKYQAKTDIDIKKDALVDAISSIANKSTTTDDAIEMMEDDESNIKKLIMDLSIGEEESNAMSASRSARIMQLQSEMDDKYIKGIKVKDLLNSSKDAEDISDPIPSTKIPVASPFKEQWSNMKFMNFDKGYNVDLDIIKIINSLSNKQFPLVVRDINVEDTSTSEDFIDTYTIKFEDFTGRRFTTVFDVPKFKNDRYLILRGNKKYIQNQYFNLPVLKTDESTCQLISNYNKIIIKNNGTIAGKSIEFADRIIKASKKYNGNIKFSYGDNSLASNNYELPIDYVDLSGTFNKIESSDYIFYFNQEEINEIHKDQITNEGLPYGYDKRNKYILYYNSGRDGYPLSSIIANYLSYNNEEWKIIYESINPSVRYSYSDCSIMNSMIPLVVVASYSVGLTKVLNLANIQYRFVEKLTKEDRSVNIDKIKFKDGYLVYELNYASSLLLNGLKSCLTEDYSIKDINSRSTYINFLDNLGISRIKADGLDNFYECFVDPITEEVAKHYKLPSDYISMLLYANALLADNKYIKHVDSSSKRVRRGELIASKAYKVLINDAYCTYANSVRHNRKGTMFSVKRSAIIDRFMTDNTSSDLSVINGLNDIESINSVSTKGENGMNNDRSYGVDKRSYDESMLNLLGMSTGFAGNVGITRQATLDMNIESERGYTKVINKDYSKLNTQKTLTATEALTPMGSTRDDPFRTAMTFIQTAKHAVRTDKSDPLLVTNGSDEAIPYIMSDIFAFKAKEDGVVIEYVDNDYMIVEYTSKAKEYISLKPTIEKNSDGGFYTTVELVPTRNIDIGSKVKAGSIIANDKKSFSNNLGESDNLAYNIGKLAKIAILNSDECFEDSAIVTQKICKELATDIVLKKERVLDKNTNIYNMVKVGQEVEEGEVLFQFQAAFEDDDLNILMKNLKGSSDEISSLSRNFVKSSVNGKIVGIKIYRTCDLEEMSESLQSLVKKYEAPINSMKKKLKSYNISGAELDPTEKVSLTGKMKNKEDSVMIEIYIEYHDIMSVGDKVVYWSANKGVIKDIIPEGLEPYTELRPDEEVSAYTGVSSINKRMVMSSTTIGSLNKLMIELARTCREKAGIPYIKDEI